MTLKCSANDLITLVRLLVLHAELQRLHRPKKPRPHSDSSSLYYHTDTLIQQDMREATRQTGQMPT